MLEIDWIYHTCCHNYELLIISGQLLCIWSEAILSLMRLQETNKVYDNVPIEDVVNIIRWVQKDLWWMEHVIRACFLSLVRSKLRLCSANHRPGYWSNLPCDWLSTAWAYSEAIAGAATLWPVRKSSLCNLFEDRAPVDEIYWCRIFKWVAVWFDLR